MIHYFNNKDIEPWPKDWTKHVVKSNELYFSDFDRSSIEIDKTAIVSESIVSSIPLEKICGNSYKELSILDTGTDPFTYETTILQVIYKNNNKRYLVDYNMDPFKSSVSAIVYRILYGIQDLININEIDYNSALVPCDNSMYVCEPLGYFIANSGFECAEKIENIINKDWGDDEDQDNDFNDNPDPSYSPSLNYDPVCSY